MIINELITVFSFQKGKGSDKALKQYQNSISNLRKQALLAGAAFSGLGLAAGKIIQGVDQQAKFARGIGISFEKLRQFQFAAQKAGASTSEFNSFIGNLSRTLVSLNPGDYNKFLFRLGVAARDAQGNLRPLDKVILNIAKNVTRFNAIRRQQLIGGLGGSLNITNFLSQGSSKIQKDLQEAISTGFVIPERLTGQFAEFFDDSLLRLRSTIKGFSEVIIASLLPSLTKVVDNLEAWILANKELIGSNIGAFLKGAGEAISAFGNGIKFALDSITALIKPLTGTNSELKTAEVLGFAAASAVTALAGAAVLAAGEWVALAAAITAVISLLPKIKNLSGFLPDQINPFKIPEKLKELRQLQSPSSLEEFRSLAAARGDFSALAPASTTNNSSNATATINNTFNINGSQSPLETARRVKEEFELSRALQSASPGFNRPRVG